LEKNLENQLKFEHDPKLGFITTFPDHLGTTLDIEIKIKMPNLRNRRPLDYIEDLAKNYPNQTLSYSNEVNQAQG
jgi:protein-arginine kinase